MCCAALLLYFVVLYCCTVWLDGPVSVHGFVCFFLWFMFFPLYRPHAGIVRHTIFANADNVVWFAATVPLVAVVIQLLLTQICHC